MKGSIAKPVTRRWTKDPVSFVRECLKAEPDKWQAKTLRAMARDPEVNPEGKRRFAAKASKGVGKSTLEAWAIWWFLATRLHPKIVCTSISGDNLRDGLWTELSKWQAKSPFLQAAFTWNAERIASKDHPETWWCSARQWSKTADPSQQALTLAGIHSENVLIVADEVGGIPDGVVAAAEAGLATATDGILLIGGNPTHLSGPLYRACTRERHLWWVIEISSDPDDSERASRVSIQWAREQIEKYGRDSPYVLVNVFGKFPPSQSNALLGVETVTAACRRTIAEHAYMYAPKVLGVDVARFGEDRTVLFPRQGLLAMQPKVFRDLDTVDVAGQVSLAIARWQPDAVFVDQTGIGAGVVDQLRRQHFDIIGVDFGSKSMTAEPRMANRRVEMWWKMADWVKSGGCLPDAEELVGELTAPTYRFDVSGRLVLESKDDIKSRGLPSPDLADALALTFAFPVQRREATQRNTVHGVATEYDHLQERNEWA